jgi:4-amino-4-deoxy-L-arabinose transferase-like glycosyltransferase
LNFIEAVTKERSALVIAGVAFLAALLFSQLVFPLISGSLRLQTDSDKYGEVGWNIVKHHRFMEDGVSSESMDKGPMYPHLLAAVYLVGGERNDRAVQVLQAFLHALTVLIVFAIALWLRGLTAARIASGLTAFHPLLIWYTARIWTETLHTFLLTFSAYLLMRLIAEGGVRRTILLGISIGCALLTKSTLILFLPLLAVFCFMAKERRTAAQLIAAFLVSLLVISPWTMRNYELTEKFVPVHVSLGFNMIQGDVVGQELIHYPFSTMQLWEIGKYEVDTTLAKTGYNEWSPEGDRILVAASLRSSLSNPLVYCRRIAANLLTFWYLSESEMKSLFLFLLQIPLAIAFFMSLKRWASLDLGGMGLVVLILYFVVLHGLVVGWARYSAPIVPLLLALTCAAYASAPGSKS